MPMSASETYGEVHVQSKRRHKSFTYTNSVVWNRDRRGKSSTLGKPGMDVGSPPEFKGEAGVWSPEELLVSAVNACLMLTFVSFAQSKGIEFVAYESPAEGLLENVDGKYRFTEVKVEPSVVLKSEADLEAARANMPEVEPNCFISNSITAKVSFAPRLRVASAGQTRPAPASDP
jgi:organic hydroperoxide reductase OsmC/OhrA